MKIMSRFVKEHTGFAFSASPDDDFGLNLFNHALKPQSETSLNCPDYKSIPIIDGWRHFDRFEKKWKPAMRPNLWQIDNYSSGLFGIFSMPDWGHVTLSFNWLSNAV